MTINRKAVVFDANFIIGFVAKEADKSALATERLCWYVNEGYELHSIDLMLYESLFRLCRKKADSHITDAIYDVAMGNLKLIARRIVFQSKMDCDEVMQSVIGIREGYGCGFTADSFYLAYAIKLSSVCDVTIATFDERFAKRIPRLSTAIKVDYLPPVAIAN